MNAQPIVALDLEFVKPSQESPSALSQASFDRGLTPEQGARLLALLDIRPLLRALDKLEPTADRESAA